MLYVSKYFVVFQIVTTRSFGWQKCTIRNIKESNCIHTYVHSTLPQYLLVSGANNLLLDVYGVAH